jgi:predicted PurR-regulated permease PerM
MHPWIRRLAVWAGVDARSSATERDAEPAPPGQAGLRPPAGDAAAQLVVPSAPQVVVPARDRAPFAVLLLAAIGILWVARGVLGPFIVAAVLAYAFSPLVSAGERRTGWPRIVVVAIGYGITTAVVAVLVFLFAGRIVHEVEQLANSDSLERTLRELVHGDVIAIGGQSVTVSDLAREIQARIAGLISSPGDALHAVGLVGEAGLEAILAVIVTFYFLVDGSMFMDRTIDLMPIAHRGRTRDVLARIHVILGKWLRGQLFLIALVAAVTYVGLGPVLHLPYALALAILTGVLEIIPLIGPLAATAIVAVDAFARGGVGTAVAVIVFYFVLRQIEDQVVAPIVIGRAVHLHPVVTIFAVLVGLSIYGVLGGLLGVPIAAAINVVFHELYPTAAVDEAGSAPAGAAPVNGP